MEKKEKKKIKGPIEYEKFGTETGDKISQEICNEITIYRAILYLLPFAVGAPTTGLATELVTGLNFVNPLVAISAVCISMGAVDVAKYCSKKGMETLLDNKDGKNNETLDIIKGDKIVKIDVSAVLQAAIISGTDYILFGRIIQELVDHRIEIEAKTNEKNDENNDNAKDAIQVGKALRSQWKSDRSKIENVRNKQLKELELTDKIADYSGKISRFFISVALRIAHFTPTSIGLFNIIISRYIKSIPKKILEIFSHRELDKNDGNLDNLVGKLPATIALEIEKLTRNKDEYGSSLKDTQLYEKLEEIYATRQKEMKVGMDNLYQGKELRQKTANILSKNKLLMKIWFIKDFVTKQTLALPPARINRFGERVYDEKLIEKTDKEIPHHRTPEGEKFANNISRDGKLQLINTTLHKRKVTGRNIEEASVNLDL